MAIYFILVIAWLYRATVHDMNHIQHAVAIKHGDYRMVGNFGGNLIWRIAEISVFGGIYFGGLAKPVP